MKKLITVSLASILMCSNVFAADISVKLNGDTVGFSGQQPVIVEGRTLIPLRGVFEKLGYDISWDGENKTASFTKGTDVIEIAVNANDFTVNGEKKPLDVPAQIINGSMLLPLRAVGEAAGLTVNWNSEEKIVNLTDSENKTMLISMVDNLSYYCIVSGIIDQFGLITDFRAEEMDYEEIISYEEQINEAAEYIKNNQPEDFPNNKFSEAAVDALKSEFVLLKKWVKGDDISEEEMNKFLDIAEAYGDEREGLYEALEQEIITYSASIGDDTILNEYKKQVTEILNKENDIFNRNYANDYTFVKDIPIYTNNVRNQIANLDIPDSAKDYQYILNYALDAADKFYEIESRNGENSILDSAIQGRCEIMHDSLLENFFGIENMFLGNPHN